MSALTYRSFDNIREDDFLLLFNKNKIRTHLIPHEMFTRESLSKWVKDKKRIDTIDGCKIRAVYYQQKLVGWCGIQVENDKYEIAIILDDKVWGHGKTVFNQVMCWAKELGHDVIYIHFLHTRPKYQFLTQLATNISDVVIFGERFTCYQLSV